MAGGIGSQAEDPYIRRVGPHTSGAVEDPAGGLLLCSCSIAVLLNGLGSELEGAPLHVTHGKLGCSMILTSKGALRMV